jgi:hypothetical protein
MLLKSSRGREVISLSSTADPVGRLDLLLMRLAEAGTRWAERKAAEKFGAIVNLWDGPEGFGHVLKTKVEELGFSEPVPMTPLALAEALGFIKSRKLKRVS